MLHFIEKSPTCFHAVKNAAQMLEEEGYVNLKEEAWALQPGGKYYVVRNGSAILAFRVPNEITGGFMLAVSHSDSPCFRLRDHAELAGGYVRLSAEKYGGLIHASWVDRPLSIAGRVVVKHESGVQTKLVDFEKDMVLIPNIAIHLNREMNSGTKYDANTDLVPLYGLGNAEGCFSKELALLAGCKPEDVLGTDLFVYNNQKGTVWGADNAFVSAPRLDDLACVYSSLQAFLAAKETKSIPVYAVFDNEEIGSMTKQGAASPFLKDTLERIANSLELPRQEYLNRLSQSFMLSADNAHAFHPNYPDKCDPVNKAVMGGGVVLKFSGNQKYTTDAVSAAIVRLLAGKADVRLQTFTNHSDIPGGSTLGNISSQQLAIKTADVGIAQLAMHSPYETCGSTDTEELVKLARMLFSASLTDHKNGTVEVLFP